MASHAEGLILLPYQARWLADKSPRKIWLAARQTGKSFSLALEAVTEAAERRSVNLILSASERQSREVMEKVLAHLRHFRARLGGRFSTDETREEVRLPNGSRIISLPANPDTVRGFSGNVFLDEFAFHKDAGEIWRAMYPAVTRGFRVRVSSTPNGKAGSLFHTLWSTGSSFSRHRTDIYDAVGEGLPINTEELRAGIIDPEAWAQEYECAFLDGANTFIPYELIAACEHEEATKDFDAAAWQGGREADEFFLGVDIGRRRDLTVFWLWQKTGDVFWTRMVKEMQNASFAMQRDFLYRLLDGSFFRGALPHCRTGSPLRRCCLDSTGIGAQLAEEAAEAFGPVVEPVTFSLSVKEKLAVRMRRLLEERRLRIPASREIREDFSSVKRSATFSGSARFFAGETGDGHADRFWAAALGIGAAERPVACIEHESAGPRVFAAIGGSSGGFF